MFLANRFGTLLPLSDAIAFQDQPFMLNTTGRMPSPAAPGHIFKPRAQLCAARSRSRLRLLLATLTLVTETSAVKDRRKDISAESMAACCIARIIDPMLGLEQTLARRSFAL